MIFHIDDPESNISSQCTSQKYLIYTPSGKFKGWREETPDVLLFSAISESLQGKADIFLLPFLSKEDKYESDDLFISEQYEVLKTFLLSNQKHFHAGCSISFVSISLGSHVLMKLLSDEALTNITPSRCILISLVLENKVDVYSNVPYLYLVYGANDWVGYYGPGDTLEVIPPHDYSRKTAELIFTDRTQKKEVIILDGHGHYLENSTDHSYGYSLEIVLNNLAYSE